MAGDPSRAQRYFAAIDKTSLNIQQQILIKLPGIILRFGLWIQGFLARMGVRLSVFSR
jgi:hypothetical protein